MIILGVILLIIGGAVLYFFAENIIRFVGAVLLLLGLAAVVIGVLDASDVHAAVRVADDMEGLARSSWG